MRLYARKCPTKKHLDNTNLYSKKTLTHSWPHTTYIRVHTSVSHGQSRSVKILTCHLFVCRSHSHKTQSIMTWTLTSRNTSHLLSGRWTIWQQHEGQKVARYIKQTLRPSRNTCQPAALALDRNKALCSWPELTANQISHSQINIHDPRVAGKPGTTGYYDWIRVTKN